MPFAEGFRLASYEIVAPLGAGGMGEVYRARDTRLGRDVALKVLPEELAHDIERMARLRREAQVLASLNHSNIASIYGFEDSGNVHALVMELVEGLTLAERITNGAIPLEEALPIAKQIAEGLEYAHERGIVHRDLKPSNVKVTHEGAVKILDFGLAKAIEGDPSTTSVENSPTLSAMATHAGFLLGTAAYMSPEQARGKRADRRADIWAFGVVLFEMLSGERLFSGETTSDTLAAVIRAEPNWNVLPANTPPSVRNLLARCLKKDPRQRLQSIGDARIAIEEVLSGAPQDASSSSAVSAPQIPTPAWRRALPWTVAFLTGVAMLVLLHAYWRASRLASSAPAIVSQILPPPNTNFVFGGFDAGPPAISPDGKRLAFVAAGSDGKQELWVRPLDSTTAQPLAGTDGASFPFWSPDSRSIGFFANGKLNRMDASGGPSLALADAAHGRGGAWGPDGTILFSPNSRTALFRVPASGGTPQQVTKLDASDQEITHRWPQFLPDGKHFLFYSPTVATQAISTYAGSLDGGPPQPLLRADSNAVYAPPGYLLFVRQGTLMAQRFDPGSLRLIGEAMPLASDAEVDANIWRGVFSASSNGILVYQAGNALSLQAQLLWFDRSGRQVGETGTGGDLYMPSLSPDGRKLAVTVTTPGVSPYNIWVYDLTRGIRTRLTFSPALDAEAAWSPDGKTIAFVSNRSGQSHLYEKAADGTGSSSPLVVDNTSESRPSFSADGRYLIFQRGLHQHAGSHFEIWALPLFGDRKPFPVIQNPSFDAGDPALSPDGKWLAYVSTESGRTDVYIAPFPRGSGKWQVSSGGGTWPRWRRDGRELFYFSLDNKIISAQISEQGASLVIGKVAPLFQTNPVPSSTWPYDVTADGSKFVVATQAAPKTKQSLTLVVNWPALLRKQ